MRLIEYLAPHNLDKVVGQDHILGKNTILRSLLLSENFESLCFYGPPGVGKSTVAMLISDLLSLKFYKFHAATTGIKEIKNIFNSQDGNKNGLLILIDEIHRFNRNQQELLLYIVDEKKAKIISTSTENPYYNLLPALRSRSFLFEFKPINQRDMKALMGRAMGQWTHITNIKSLKYSEEVFKYIFEHSGGDIRRFLNTIEAVLLSSRPVDDVIDISMDNIGGILGNVSYSVDEHYDLLSAMIKSIRGSDPDAALVWTFKLLKVGVAPETVLRRLLILASEDIGNAYPEALIFSESAYGAFEKVGFPEGNIILAHLVTYLASCPKSNRAYKSLDAVSKYLNENNPKPPKNIVHNSKSYKYPFDFGGFVAQKYMDYDGIFYKPSNSGYEKRMNDRLRRIWGDAKKYDKK